MLMSNNTPKSHITRTSSMRRLAADDSVPPQPLHSSPQNSPTDHHQPQSAAYIDYTSSFLSAMISPRSHNHHGRNSSGGFDQSNFLIACGLCHRRLAVGRDLYMYKGDAAFCSLECREEQMKRDGTSAEGN